MKTCPQCSSPLEPFEDNCHSCGKPLTDSHKTPPVVSSATPSASEIEQTYASWLARGKDALNQKNYEEASNCLREAIKRCHVLPEAHAKELAARELLALSLQKLNKIMEAADQYRTIALATKEPSLTEKYLKTSQELATSVANLPYDFLFHKEEFRALKNDEIKYVPLYCVGCKRLLAEAEVYSLRKGFTQVVHCWCGTEGRPLVKEDAKHLLALEEGRSQDSRQRNLALQIASQSIPGGKNKTIAIILAFTFGWLGAHKFYLGETTLGLFFLFWFWTGIPLLIAIYEAIMLIMMSRTTFNLTYNIELVLAQLPPESELQTSMEVFSLESTDDTLNMKDKPQG